MRLLALALLLCAGCRFNSAGIGPADRSSVPGDQPRDVAASDIVTSPELTDADGPKPPDAPKPGDIPQSADRRIDMALADKPLDKKPLDQKPLDKPPLDKPPPKPDLKADLPKPDRYTPWPCSTACPGQKCCWISSSWTCHSQTAPDHCLCDPGSEEPCKTSGVASDHTRCVMCKGAYQCWQASLLYNCP